MATKGGIILRGKNITGVGKDKKPILASMLYDRVINLQFIREHDGTGNTVKPTSFTLRSDYECVIDNRTGHYVIRKCVYKPSIRLEYKQLPGNTEIRATIFVANMHSYSLGANSNMSYVNANNPIKKIVCQLGYFAQFPNFNKMPDNGLTVDDYFNLTASGVYPESVQTIDFMVLAEYPVNNPPDAEMCFECVIGSVGQDFHAKESRSLPSDMSLKAYLHEVITRQYPKKLLAPEDSTVVRDGPMPEGSELLAKYGTKVYLSDKASAISFTRSNPPTFPDKYNNVNTAISWIVNNLKNELRFVPLVDGDYVCFVEGEDPYAVLNSDGLKGLLNDEIVLPAVYKISYGGTRTIQCMYFKDIRPFININFSTSYNLANRIGFFYSPSTGTKTDADKNAFNFVPVILTVRFATVEDTNMVEMMSIDKTDTGGTQ